SLAALCALPVPRLVVLLRARQSPHSALPSFPTRRSSDLSALPRPRTPGAKRAAPGEYVFDLARVNHILGGPDYSTADGSCVEGRSEEHTSELQSHLNLVCRLLLEKKNDSNETATRTSRAR